MEPQWLSGTRLWGSFDCAPPAALSAYGRSDPLAGFRRRFYTLGKDQGTGGDSWRSVVDRCHGWSAMVVVAFRGDTPSISRWPPPSPFLRILQARINGQRDDWDVLESLERDEEAHPQRVRTPGFNPRRPVPTISSAVPRGGGHQCHSTLPLRITTNCSSSRRFLFQDQRQDEAPRSLISPVRVR
jgi:hypothetical protein